MKQIRVGFFDFETAANRHFYTSQGETRLKNKKPVDGTGEDSPKSNEANETSEKLEFEDDPSPKRGITFIFVAAGFSLFLLALLAGFRPYVVSKIVGVDYSQVIIYGYNHLLDLTYAVIATSATGLVAALLYYSWSGERKLFPDALLIGLSVSIFSLFLQSEAVRVGYTLDWFGILVLLVLGCVSGSFGPILLSAFKSRSGETFNRFSL